MRNQFNRTVNAASTVPSSLHDACGELCLVWPSATPGRIRSKVPDHTVGNYHPRNPPALSVPDQLFSLRAGQLSCFHRRLVVESPVRIRRRQFPSRWNETIAKHVDSWFRAIKDIPTWSKKFCLII